jgi:16S rRNA (uracil1498-N3)-methyltransferase
MALPYFYTDDYDPAQESLALDEDTSKHIVQVLRMKPGEGLRLTDGRGNLLSCTIVDDNKRRCLVSINDKEFHAPQARRVSIAISLLKNPSRFEWFLEKATELGVSEIIPLICERTEKEKFRADRLSGICIAAMLQSQQSWLPSLHKPVAFSEWIGNPPPATDLWIAHCLPGEKNELGHHRTHKPNTVACIGPEGDFTKEEIAEAILNGFIPAGLGNTRLRAETAGVVAAALLVQSA